MKNLLAAAVTISCILFMSVPNAFADEEQAVTEPMVENIKVYRRASCGCCKAWMKYLEFNGFTVEDEVMDDVQPVKDRLGVPGDKGGCHTAEIDGYVIEGHVSAEDIRRLLTERPEGAMGLTVPDMPPGSPGMEVAPGREVAYETLLFYPTGKASVFSVFTPEAAQDSESEAQISENSVRE